MKEDKTKDKNKDYSKLKSHLRPQWGIKLYISIAVGIFILIITAIHLKLDFIDVLVNSGGYLADLSKRLFPPDFSNFGQLLFSMLETVEIAIWGTFLAIILSIPLSFLSARNIAPNRIIYAIARIIIVFFRAVPEFILAMFLVISVGFGAISGIFALGLHTMGFLSKFYAEEMEHVSKGPVDALTAVGAKKSQIVFYAIIPQVLHAFIANNLYILDRNVRMATMLGIVGAGGIGYELISSFRMFKYQRVSAIILIIFVTILIIDFVSSNIRKKLV